jgi:hypothetical protein
VKFTYKLTFYTSIFHEKKQVIKEASKELILPNTQKNH